MRDEVRQQTDRLAALEAEQLRCRHAVHLMPLGEDRRRRRYWVLPSLAFALLVEAAVPIGTDP